MGNPQITFQICSPHLSASKQGTQCVEGTDKTSYRKSLIEGLKKVQKQINDDLTDLIDQSQDDEYFKPNKGVKRSVDDQDEESEDDDDMESDKESKKKKISKK